MHLDSWPEGRKRIKQGRGAEGEEKRDNPDPVKCINKSRALLKDTGLSIAKFHSHSTGFEIIRQANKTKMAIQIGTIMSMGDVNYAKHPEVFNGSQSVGLFYLSKKSDDFHYVPIPIHHSGKTIVNGKLFSV